MKKYVLLRRLIQGIIACLFVTVVMTPACSSDSEDELLPDCDLENVTYSEVIAPIMAASCNACHTGAGAPLRIRTDNYADLSEIALSSRLMGAINHDEGFSPMPQGQPQLDKCTRDQIAAWATVGAPSN